MNLSHAAVLNSHAESGGSTGKRDTTTRESVKVDRDACIRSKVSNDPAAPVFDSQGYRMRVDPKTGEVNIANLSIVSFFTD